MNRLVRRVVFSLVGVLALATGCFAGKETREGADKLEDALGTPSWAQSVDVETSVSGLTDDEVVTTVVLNRTPRPTRSPTSSSNIPTRSSTPASAWASPTFGSRGATARP